MTNHQEAQAIKDLYQDELLAWETVAGVGLGQDSLGQPVLTIFLTDASLKDWFPCEIDGLPVVYEIVGQIVGSPVPG